MVVAFVKNLALTLMMIPVRFVAWVLFYCLAAVFGVSLLIASVVGAIHTAWVFRWVAINAFGMGSRDDVFLFEGVGMLIGAFATFQSFRWVGRYSVEVVRGKVMSKKVKV